MIYDPTGELMLWPSLEESLRREQGDTAEKPQIEVNPREAVYDVGLFQDEGERLGRLAVAGFAEDRSRHVQVQEQVSDLTDGFSMRRLSRAEVRLLLKTGPEWRLGKNGLKICHLPQDF